MPQCDAVSALTDREACAIRKLDRAECSVTTQPGHSSTITSATRQSIPQLALLDKLRDLVGDLAL